MFFTFTKNNRQSQSSVPFKLFFFRRISDFLEQGQMIFGNMVITALENLTNLQKMTLDILQ